MSFEEFFPLWLAFSVVIGGLYRSWTVAAVMTGPIVFGWLPHPFFLWALVAWGAAIALTTNIAENEGLR